MNTEDKLYNKIKTASEKGETPNFPGMDKVWNRVEDKLEANVSKTESTKWKKIAIAASVLVLGTIGYQFFNSNNEIEIQESVVINKDSIITNEVIVEHNSFVEDKNEIEKIQPKNPAIVTNAEEVLKTQIEKPAAVVIVEEKTIQPFKDESIQTVADKMDDTEMSLMPQNNVYKASPKYEVTYTEAAVAKSATQTKKEEPLIIMDGKAKKGMKAEQLNGKEIDSIVYLANPLYIINGEEFSEQELFGPKPTSKYAPLNKQDITATTVYQGEDAIKLYGNKGKNGVVIITTKNGKPKN